MDMSSHLSRGAVSVIKWLTFVYSIVQPSRLVLPLLLYLPSLLPKRLVPELLELRRIIEEVEADLMMSPAVNLSRKKW